MTDKQIIKLRPMEDLNEKIIKEKAIQNVFFILMTNAEMAIKQEIVLIAQELNITLYIN